jgi:hypothetical protein
MGVYLHNAAGLITAFLTDNIAKWKAKHKIEIALKEWAAAPSRLLI